jgi:hypothetical protein
MPSKAADRIVRFLRVSGPIRDGVNNFDFVVNGIRDKDFAIKSLNICFVRNDKNPLNKISGF